MTRYKLPDELGGAEVKVLHGMAHVSDDGGDHKVDVVIDGLGTLCMPARWLTEVEEPLPEEPPIGSVVRAQLVDEDEPWAWERSTDHHNGPGWYMAGADSTFEWAALCKRGTPVLLVPAPEPVELPCEIKGITDGTSAIATLDRGNSPLLQVLNNGHCAGVLLRAETCRDMARALWTAADRSES